jgi:hypothetical protein
MNKQKNYVPPGVEICRVETESGVAVPTSIGPVKAQVEKWDTGVGSAYTFGDEFPEGGEIFVYW